jgi:hypothetical protein
MSTLFFVATSNDYVWAFRQSSLYYAFLQVGAFGTGLNKNELCMCRVTWFEDPIQIVTAIAKYTSSFDLYVRIPHLEGEKFFGSIKHKVNLPPRSEVDSHQHDQVNFSHLKVANVTTSIN